MSTPSQPTANKAWWLLLWIPLLLGPIAMLIFIGRFFVTGWGYLAVPFALGAAGLTTFLPGKFTLKRNGIFTTGAVGIFVYLVSLFRPTQTDFSIRLLLQRENLSQINLADCNVAFYLGTIKREGKPQSAGDIEFDNIPIKYLQSSINFIITPPVDYTLVQTNFPDVLNNEAPMVIKLKVNLNNHVFGWITDQSGAKLTNVSVSINTKTRFSDSNGYYSLILDTLNLSDDQEINFSKNGFRPERTPLTLHNLVQLNMALHHE